MPDALNYVEDAPDVQGSIDAAVGFVNDALDAAVADLITLYGGRDPNKADQLRGAVNTVKMVAHQLIERGVTQGTLDGQENYA